MLNITTQKSFQAHPDLFCIMLCVYKLGNVLFASNMGCLELMVIFAGLGSQEIVLLHFFKLLLGKEI